MIFKIIIDDYGFNLKTKITVYNYDFKTIIIIIK